MSATITSTLVANSALRKLGKDRISSLEENTPTAIQLKEDYDLQVQREFETHPWRFAITRITLPKDATAMAFGTEIRYLLPSNTARVLRVNNNTVDEHCPIIIEGKHLLWEDGTDTAELVYVQDDVATDFWPAAFAEAVAYRIAIANCESLTKSSRKMQQLVTEYKVVINQAKRNQAIERRFDPGTPDAFELARL